MRKTWFVTFRPRDPSRLPEVDGHRRMSENFESEADAKAFAADRLKDSSQIVAGTLNPVIPKRIIGSARIFEWVDEPSETSKREPG